ncbi:SDR family oxidoreductase [Chelativorans salis]|uniref:SDR family oxidoreductase n=1 Tax=Chelativorans salis TaxID=2978478 RepID=A0ABT2LUF6_9HYPH|nr:SDR family oxidoreductase [Chelativorans sp. EGI FJ00035]MCT7378167.1 SDR family oxidoreductase [Chelativorans sp. EGI FJ00035]
MKVLVTGASGLIGSAVCARLSAEGHEVIAAVRPGSRPLPMAAREAVEIDMARAGGPEAWAPHLGGVDAVVNCAGVFQDNPRDSTRGVHVTGAEALFRACETAGVRRVIHFSALGVDRERPTAFSTTKLQGDTLLMERDLDWVILRPSVVLGRSAFGGSALMRGLAALPLMPVMRHTGQLQVVQLDDVAATIAFFLRPSAPSRLTLELAGPERLSMSEVVATYRRWLGWQPARGLTLPDALTHLLYRLGDFAGRLGWRPAIRSTAEKEIALGAVGDPTHWTEVTGIRPTALAAALEKQPAGVQERWFAKLFFLKPVIFIVLAAFWIVTGIVSLTAGFREGVDLLMRTGAGTLSAPGVVAGALADIAIGLAIAWRQTARQGLYGAIALSLLYAVASTLLMPSLWADPLGPLVKIVPIFVLHLVALAILDER